MPGCKMSLGGSPVVTKILFVQLLKQFSKLYYAVFSSTNQEDLKLGQCLDIGDMTSPSKFGEVT